VAKRLSDILQRIEGSGEEFKAYLQRILNHNIYEAIDRLSVATDVYIFSGVIRNFFLKVSDYRDLDIVLADDIDVRNYFENSRIRQNSFGGFKIYSNDTSIDLWTVNKTWAFKHQSTFQFQLKELMPSTAFFNFSAIIYSFRERKFYASYRFCQFLRDKKIDLVYEPNANLPLCVVNTFYYEDKLGLKVAARMKRHILNLHKSLHAEYRTVQEKHFGKILYSDSDILQKLAGYSYSLEAERKRRNSHSLRHSGRLLV
jgi:hypothetical protein